MAKILAIEDDPIIQTIVRGVLKDHLLIAAHTLAEARTLIAQHKDIELFILDLILPDGDGFLLCQELSANPDTKQVPVIILSGRSEPQSKVAGFSLGAEDYVVKPIEPMEFRARVEHRLKKSRERGSEEKQISIGELNFNLDTRTVQWVTAGSIQNIDLTGFEFKLLLFFARHLDHVVSRETLLEEVWEGRIHVSDRTVDSHVSHIRKRIAHTPYIIRSIYGEGYRFSVKAATAKLARTA